MAQYATNGGRSTLLVPPTGTAGTSCQIQSADTGKFPSSGDFACLLQDSLTAPTQFEIIEVTSVSGNTWTITRASEPYAGSSAAQTWSANHYVTQVMTVGTIQTIVLPTWSAVDVGKALKLQGDSVGVYFDGSSGGASGVLSNTGTAPFRSNSWTITEWIYMTGYPGANVWTFNGGANSTDNYVQVEIYSGGNIGVGFFGDDWNTGHSPTLNAWNSITITYDSVANSRAAYLNGVSLGSNTPSGVLNVPTGSTYGLAIWPGSSNAKFQGTVSHLAVFSGVLTSTDISNIYSNASSMSEVGYVTFMQALSPLLYWTLQETSGTVMTNYGSTGSIDNMTYTGGYTLGEQGPISGNLTPKWM